MSFMLPSSINLVEFSGRPWSDIEFTEKDGGTSSKKSSSNSKEYKATRQLPRTDHPLFGQFPKLETKVLLECDKCGKVLLPSVFHAHCSNPEHKNMQPIVQQVVAPSKSSNRNRKPATKPSATFANAAGASSSHSSSVTLMVSKPPPTPTPVAATAPIAPPVPVVAAAATSNGRTSKHKKSSKSNKRSRKEDKIEPPSLAVTTALPSPEAHSHPAKVSKQDAEHVVASVTIAPSIPLSHPFDIPEQPAPLQSAPVVVKAEVLVKEELPELRCDVPIATSTVSTVVSPRPAFIKLAQDAATSPNHVISICRQVEVQPPMVAVKEEPVAAEAITVSNDIKENQDNSPVDHMPMSPVAVVNIVPVQNFQYLQQYLQLPTQPIVVTIPCSSPSTHMYSYPKPLTVTTRAIRKIGNTYLLQNQRLDRQRADIQAITRSRRAYSNASTLNHLPT